MARALRILAIVIAVIVVLVLVLPFLIPVNQFRPTIEQKASAALGRKVEVGNLRLSLFTGSLAADNLSVGDDPKFSQSPFLTAKSVKVGVELVPLIFSKQLNVTDVTIDTPQVTLLRNPAGRWNYSSLGATGAKSPAQQEPTAATPKQEPSPSSAASQLSVKKLELKDGRVIVGTTNSEERRTYDKVTASASDYSATSKFPVSVSATLPGGGDFKLDGTAGPIDASDTDLTPVSAKLSIVNLDLAKTGFVDPSAGLGGIVDLNATIASQNGEAQTKGSAKISKALLVAGGSPSSVPVIIDFATKYDLRKNSGVVEPSTVKIAGAVAHLNGTYQVEVPANKTVVHVKNEGKGMPATDLQAFLPAVGIHMPQGASLQSGTIDDNLDLGGPVNKLVTSGNVGLFSAKLAGFDLGSKLSAVSSLLGVNTGRDLEIEKLTTNIRVAPDGLQASNFIAVVPSLGTLVGAGTIDSKNNLDFKMIATLKSSAAPGGAAASNNAPSSSGGGLGGLLGSVTGQSGALHTVSGAVGGCKGAGQSIPFQIKGTTSDPKFVPDVGGIAAGMLKSELGCVGAPASGGNKNQPNSQNPVGGLGGLLKQKP